MECVNCGSITLKPLENCDYDVLECCICGLQTTDLFIPSSQEYIDEDD